MSENTEEASKITLAYKDPPEELPTIEIGKDGTVISLNVKEAEALLKWLPFLREQRKEAKIELTIRSYD
jgi:hypothetical protein